MTMNKAMVVAGVATLFQSIGQMMFTALGLAQYFCIIDFLRELPILVFIRILYFHNPNPCGPRINIGQAIDGMANQAFVLLTQEPMTVTRTFIINCTNLGLSALWIITSVVIIMGGARNKQSKHIRWPWLIITSVTCAVDITASVTYINDTFYTRTLSDMMDFIGGIASGTGSIEVDTSWASWCMVILSSRFVVLFLLNLFLIVVVIIDCNVKREVITNTVVHVEASANTDEVLVENDVEESSDSSVPEMPHTRIPRPGLSQSFRRMKTLLFKTPSIIRSTKPRKPSIPDSLDASPERSPQTQHVDIDKKRTVNFPENLLSLPQRLENMIAEQQRRLDKAIIDTAGRNSPPRTSQSMPQLNTETDARGRRGTAAELQGQLPWAYIPASAHPMRDQLPPDEDLPPVPLPDYTAIQPHRKASVHRAASSLSSLTQKKDYVSQQSRHSRTQVQLGRKFVFTKNFWPKWFLQRDTYVVDSE